ncbi:MAG: hypothetical protein IKD36_01835 [Clostridia bacterium]|nr:hypothetical protein [Clostridia bacterium]
MTLTIFAMVSSYGISGVLNVMFIIIPINLLYIAVMIFFAGVCKERSKLACDNKNVFFGIKSKDFILFNLISVGLVFVIVFVGVIVFPFVLKNAIFVIF